MREDRHPQRTVLRVDFHEITEGNNDFNNAKIMRTYTRHQAEIMDFTLPALLLGPDAFFNVRPSSPFSPSSMTSCASVRRSCQVPSLKRFGLNEAA